MRSQLLGSDHYAVSVTGSGTGPVGVTTLAPNLLMWSVATRVWFRPWTHGRIR